MDFELLMNYSMCLIGRTIKRCGLNLFFKNCCSSYLSTLLRLYVQAKACKKGFERVCHLVKYTGIFETTLNEIKTKYQEGEFHNLVKV